jgi:hypothetical protein
VRLEEDGAVGAVEVRAVAGQVVDLRPGALAHRHRARVEHHDDAVVVDVDVGLHEAAAPAEDLRGAAEQRAGEDAAVAGVIRVSAAAVEILVVEPAAERLAATELARADVGGTVLHLP